MELIDTHCHLTFAELAGDVEGVITRSIAAGVTGWVTVGTDAEQIKKVLAVAGRYENMYAAVGVHPHYAKDVSPDDLIYLKEAVKNDKVVAVGETGLDFHYNFSEQDRQKEIFRVQLEIAREVDKPVIVHCREAFDETMAILDDFAGRLKKVVVHCFSGNAQEAQIILAKGWYISFTGIVTFKKKVEQTIEAARIVPVERMMVETDAPYISPEPVREQRPCEPALMVHTAMKLAQIKEMDFEDFAKAVTATSKRFFNLS